MLIRMSCFLSSPVKSLAGELAALIGVEDLRGAVAV
jgi:hypothetical protein